MGMVTLQADTRIGVLGLGYVGLPLAHALAEHYPIVGYDINPQRITDINQGRDVNGH